MKSMRKSIIISLPFILLLSFALPISYAQDGETNELSIVPEWQTVYFNETFTADIVVNSTTGVYGVQCLIEFDPSLIEVQSIEKGSLLVGDAIFFKSYDNVGGKIDIQAFNFSFALNQSFPMYHGVLASITFKAKEKVGTSPLNFVPSVAGTPKTFFDAGTIPVLNNGTVEVRNYPV
ncbi:MAG: hypothetical protein DRN12_06950, partial [Thermoplasmata archaeon]